MLPSLFIYVRNEKFRELSDFIGKRICHFDSVTYTKNPKGFLTCEVKGRTLFFFLKQIILARKQDMDFRIREGIKEPYEVKTNKKGEMSVNGYKVIGVHKGEITFSN